MLNSRIQDGNHIQNHERLTTMSRIASRYPADPALARRALHGRIAFAALLLLLALTASACGNVPSDDPSGLASAEGSKGTAVEAVTPEEVLSKEEIGKGAPERRAWNAPTDAEVVSLPGSEGSSAGAIPAVKPFNFGRDPGGPDDKTLYLTVPKLGLAGVPVFNSTSEEKLKESTVHVPATGFPWQEGANTFIAGHRIGYEGTGSYQIFYDLPALEEGNEITVADSAGGEYVYRVNSKEVVGPQDVEVMNPIEGESVVTLQTCTLPDYSRRVIVQAVLVDKS